MGSYIDSIIPSGILFFSLSLFMKIKRLLLKLSGEALQGRQDGGIDVDFLHDLSAKVAKIAHSGNQLVIVIG